MNNRSIDEKPDLMRQDLQRQSNFGKLIGTNVVSTDPGLREIEVQYEAQPEFTNRIGTGAGGVLPAPHANLHKLRSPIFTALELKTVCWQ